MTPIDTPQTPLRKPRRSHSAAFKQQILNEITVPGVSVASVAQRHGLNANLIHKWRKAHDVNTDNAGFLPVPLPRSARQPDPPATPPAHVLFEQGTLKIHWPITDIDRALPWIKALLS